MWCFVQFRNRICSGAFYVRRGGCWRCDRCSHGNSVKFGAWLCLVLANWRPFVTFRSFPGAAGDVTGFSRAGDVSTEAEVRHKRRQKHAVITRRFVPLSGQQPGPVEIGSRERSKETLEQAFDDDNDEFKWGNFKHGSLWVPHFIELFRPFPVDHAISPVKATGHHMVRLCRSICAEKTAQTLDPLLGSKSFTTYFIAFIAFLSSLYFSCLQNFMMFFNIWDMVLHLLGHKSLTQVTPAQTKQRPVIPVVVCGQRAPTKRRKCEEQMKSVGSSSLELRMRLPNLATSIVATAAKTFRCWRMARIKSWGTFKVSNISPVMSNWDRRHLAGGSWTLRETFSVRVSWSAKRSAFFDVF